ATEWARDPQSFPGLDVVTVVRSPLQRGLFDEESEQPAEGLPRADDGSANVEVIDARLTGEGAGARFGELVHALLAAVPLAADASAIAALAAVLGRIVSATPQEVSAAAGRVEGLLRHDMLDRARRAERRGQCRRETPVTLTLADGTLVEGVVD